MISLSAGDVIAGYRLDELVGRGGMGVVFRATHIALQREVAVKLIAPELATNEEFRERFKRESRLAASIDHPHVIGIFDAGEEAGQLYVAMRYVEGTDLAELIARQGNLPPAEAVEVIGQVGAALDAAHERGLVHRDVKPANVLLETRPRGYQTYLTDFGLVKAVGAASGVVTRTGQWLGTPDYAAPEQVLGTEVNPQTDVYALGCMLYHMVAGKPPFEGDTHVAKLFAHVSEPPPSLLAARPGVPARLDDVVRTALAKEPAERYASAGELASAAKRAIGPSPTPSGQTRVLAPAGEADSPRAERATPAWRRWLIPAAAVALLGAGVLAIVAGGGGDGERTSAAIPEGNLTSNPSFERNTSGWDVFQSDIARRQASDAPNGKNVVQVSLTGSPGEYSIDDDPETVGSSRKGRLYTASAWVKATGATDGKRICISLREGLSDGDEDFPFSAASVKGSADEYREVRVSHRAAASGKTIGVHVFRDGAGVTEGEAFLVDAITLTEGGSGSSSKTSC